jgi:hypothetical protein
MTHMIASYVWHMILCSCTTFWKFHKQIVSTLGWWCKFVPWPPFVANFRCVRPPWIEWYYVFLNIYMTCVSELDKHFEGYCVTISIGCISWSGCSGNARFVWRHLCNGTYKKIEPADAIVDFIELSFKDQFMSRADLWRYKVIHSEYAYYCSDNYYVPHHL